MPGRHQSNLDVIVDVSEQTIAQVRKDIVRPIVTKRSPVHDLNTCHSQNIVGKPACIWKQSVIITDKGNEFAGGVCKGKLPILRHGQNAIGPEMPDAAAVEALNDRFSRAVSPIVLDDNLEIVIDLIDEGCQRMSKGIGPFKRWDNQGKARHRST